MSRRRIALLAIIILAALLVWQLPALIKSIPSRYVAAYLPQSLQALAEREHVEVLPTAERKVNADLLLADLTLEDATENDEDAGSQVQPVAKQDSSQSQSPAAPEEGSQPAETGIEIADNSSPADELAENPIVFPTPEVKPLIPSSSRLLSFKHHFQTWNNCGPATLAMALSFFGSNLNQQVIAGVLKPDPEDRNVSPWEMERYVNSEMAQSALYRVNGDIETLKRFIASGYPVIVELGLDPPGEYRWMGWYGHYLLLVAYDDELRQFWAYDSWFGTSEVPAENADQEGREVAYDDLDRYWRQFLRSYIVLFNPENQEEISAIVGQDMDEAAMWRQALTTTQAELQSDPENPFLWFNLGTVYEKMEDYERSAAAFDRARELELPWRMLWYQFGPYESYYRSGRFEDVITLADVTLLDRPYFEESYYFRGLALKALGRNDEAQEDFEAAVKFNPNFQEAYEQLELLLNSS